MGYFGSPRPKSYAPKVLTVCLPVFWYEEGTGGSCRGEGLKSNKFQKEGEDAEAPRPLKTPLRVHLASLVKRWPRRVQSHNRRFVFVESSFFFFLIYVESRFSKEFKKRFSRSKSSWEMSVLKEVANLAKTSIETYAIFRAKTSYTVYAKTTFDSAS